MKVLIEFQGFILVDIPEQDPSTAMGEIEQVVYANGGNIHFNEPIEEETLSEK